MKVAGVLAAAAALAGGGWAAGRRIESPDAAARDAAPPPASTITVPVEERALSTNVVTRGSVNYDESTAVRVARASATAGIVTRSSPEVGSTLAEGALVVEADSRPTFVFGGELPAYRDITPGTQGDDVKQLQQALNRLGVFSGTVDGVYGASTQDAVTAYWRKMGYEPRPPSKGERDAVTETAARVEAARDTLRRAKEELTRAGAGPKTSERLRLDADVKRAQDELARAQAAKQPAVDEANAAVDDAAVVSRAADTARTAAAAALATARTGTNPDTNQPVTAGELTAFEKAAADADVAARQAQRALDAARAKAARTPAEQDGLIAAATDAVTLAEQTRTEALAATDTAGLKAAVDDATRALAEAEKAAADASAAAGVVVPESELVFLKDLPRRVDASAAVRGQPLPEQVLAVSGTDLVIEASVSAADRRYVTKDAKVKLDEQGLGLAFEGTVTFVADQAGTGGSGSGSGSGGGTGSGGSTPSATDRYQVRIAPGTLPATVKPTELRGINLRITIPVKSTNGKVTVVPVAALSAGADGNPRVDVEDTPGAAPRTVKVRTGLSAQGYVEISPLEGTLKVGDRVVVGRKPVATAGSAGSTSDSSTKATTASTAASDASDA